MCALQVHEARPEYAVRVPEMRRFGIMHNRSVRLGGAAEEAEEADGVGGEELALGWEAEDGRACTRDPVDV